MNRRMGKAYTLKYLGKKLGKRLKCIATMRDAYRNSFEIVYFSRSFKYLCLSQSPAFSPSLSLSVSFWFVYSLCFFNDMIEIKWVSNYTNRADLQHVDSKFLLFCFTLCYIHLDVWHLGHSNLETINKITLTHAHTAKWPKLFIGNRFEI